MAAIALVQDQLMRASVLRERSLEQALASRILIEQAKGMIAERGGLPFDEAFSRLRNYARSNNTELTSVAAALVEGELTIAAVLEGRRPRT